MKLFEKAPGDLPLFQVDAFTHTMFQGNPAAVVPLEKWLTDEQMQWIARENNLSETAFIVREGGRHRIRWFTPTVEVDLCGHATLAAAHVLWQHLDEPGTILKLDSKSGPLRVLRGAGRYLLDFPNRMPSPFEPDSQLLQALQVQPVAVARSRDLLVEVASEQEVQDYVPDLDTLAKLEFVGIIITAPGERVDFVSRFFAPRVGVAEDPVTGSAHSTLVPWWAERLQKTELWARQLSERGGELFCTLNRDRVEIGGEAVTYSVGVIKGLHL